MKPSVQARGRGEEPRNAEDGDAAAACVVAQVHVRWHLLSKRCTHLEQTGKTGRTGEQVDLLGSREKAAHATVIVAD